MQIESRLKFLSRGKAEDQREQNLIRRSKPVLKYREPLGKDLAPLPGSVSNGSA